MFLFQVIPVSLPFGYSLALRNFSKFMETALEPLCRRGIRVLLHLDDLIVMASSRECSTPHIRVFKAPVTAGFHHKLEKELSSSLPVNNLSWNVSAFIQHMSPARLEALSSFLSSSQNIVDSVCDISTGHDVSQPCGCSSGSPPREKKTNMVCRSPPQPDSSQKAVPPSLHSNLTYWKAPRVP